MITLRWPARPGPVRLRLLDVAALLLIALIAARMPAAPAMGGVAVHQDDHRRAVAQTANRAAPPFGQASSLGLRRHGLSRAHPAELRRLLRVSVAGLESARRLERAQRRLAKTNRIGAPTAQQLAMVHLLREVSGQAAYQ